MALSRKEIKDSVITTTRQNATQIGTLVNDFINLTIAEINNPGWAYPRKNTHHLWSWLRQRTSFSTVADQEDYVLPREVDKVALMRQTDSPAKLVQVTDEQFYAFDPNPTDTGNPKLYRMWEYSGVATELATADTIDVVSSSTSDAGSAELAVTVMGYVGGILQRETYQLNGTSTVSGSKTFQAREIFVSKQKDTTGTITVTENSGGTTLVTLGPDERSPRFKLVSLYPIPSSAITMNVEYYTRIPTLENDSDTPMFDEHWHYVVRLGALSKVYQYLNKETDFAIAQQQFASAVRAMVSADRTNPDLIEYIDGRSNQTPLLRLRRSDDVTVS